MKSVNKVILLGNLTRDPELRQTEHNKTVCAFGLATNRNWTTETGKKREEPEYHRLVAWETLAEFCSKYLRKGRKVYVEGRLAYPILYRQRRYGKGCNRDCSRGTGTA
jgi:single-strand DNA-binding protein